VSVANDPKFHRTSGDTLLVVQGQGGGIQPDEKDDEVAGLEVAQALDKHYPGHPWIVGFQGGALIIRHIDIANAVTMKTGKSGFGAVLPPHRQQSRKKTIESAVRFAGEMLEAFSMPRGKYDLANPAKCPDWKRGKTAGFT
jgi:hypothetical protein